MVKSSFQVEHTINEYAHYLHTSAACCEAKPKCFRFLFHFGSFLFAHLFASFDRCRCRCFLFFELSFDFFSFVLKWIKLSLDHSENNQPKEEEEKTMQKMKTKAKQNEMTELTKTNSNCPHANANMLLQACRLLFRACAIWAGLFAIMLYNAAAF